MKKIVTTGILLIMPGITALANGPQNSKSTKGSQPSLWACGQFTTQNNRLTLQNGYGYQLERAADGTYSLFMMSARGKEEKDIDYVNIGKTFIMGKIKCEFDGKVTSQVRCTVREEIPRLGGSMNDTDPWDRVVFSTQIIYQRALDGMSNWTRENWMRIAIGTTSDRGMNEKALVKIFRPGSFWHPSEIEDSHAAPYFTNYYYTDTVLESVSCGPIEPRQKF